MARKKIKKIGLMGKLRELCYGAPEDFEWSVNHELKTIANGKDLSGFKVTVDEPNNKVKFWWPIILKEYRDSKEDLPQPLTWLIMGQGRPPLGLTYPHFPGFLFYYYIPDIITVPLKTNDFYSIKCFGISLLGKYWELLNLLFGKQIVINAAAPTVMASIRQCMDEYMSGKKSEE